MKDPSQVTDKWAANLGGAGSHITAGVNAVTVPPGQAAAARKDYWVQRVTNSADKWAARVSAVSLGEWQQAMINKGIGRIAGGATAAKPKFLAFMSAFLPYVQQGADQVKRMPKGDISQSIARATFMIQHNAAFKRPA